MLRTSSAARTRIAVLTILFAGAVAAAPAAPGSSPEAQPGESARTPQAAQAEPAARRTLEIDDRFAIKSVGPGYVSPGGDWVAYTVSTTSLAKNAEKSRVWMVETAGGDPIPMTAESSSASSQRWSPDGKYLSFLAARDGGKAQVWALDRRGGEAQQLTDEKEGVSGYEWSPDGKRLVLLLRDPEDEDEGEDESDGEESGDKSGDADEEKGADVPDPHVIDRLQFKRDYVGYLDRRRIHLYVFDLASEETTQITSGDYDDSQPQWSPDGTKLAFVSNRSEEPDTNYNTDIWLVDPDNPDQGKTLVQVTTNEGEDSSPRWHPDSERIAFTTHTRPERSVFDQTKLAVVRVGGDNPVVLTETLDRWVRQPRFSPDGDLIYFILEERGSTHVAMIPTAGGEVTRPLAGERSVRAADIGPDGTVVVLTSQPGFPGELFALDPESADSVANGGTNGGVADGLRRLTHVNDELMAELDLAHVEKIRFDSADGTEVEAFVFKPPSFDPAFKYPTVLWLHGGPTAQYEWGFNFMAQWIAANGYVAVLPNPRGSTGYGVDFELGIYADWGNVDTQDVLAAVDKTIELGYSDPERLAVGGWSYGGILTNYVITSTGRFKAAMSGASGALWVANYGHDEYQRWYEDEFGLPWENRELWERLSPFNKVEQITTPTMWMGGELDWNVPIQNSEQMYQAMKRLGRDTLLIVYPNQHHGINLPTYDKDFHERVIAWYDKYLKSE